MNRVISEECSAVALYGIDPGKKSVIGFYQTVLRCFDELGYPVDKVGVVGPGHSGELVLLQRGNAELFETNFDGVTALDIYSLLPDARIPPREYILSASYSTTYSYAVVASRSSVMPLHSSGILKLTHDLVRQVNPVYGIGFIRAHRLGPTPYAIGLAQGLALVGPEDDEALLISKWSYIGLKQQVYRDGLLRDVYPWNFLTRPQLDRPVGRTTLEQWIGQGPCRGTLTRFTSDVWFWEVQDAEIPELRRELHDAGAIFDWRKFL